jgi:hypothetical protein
LTPTTLVSTLCDKVLVRTFLWRIQWLNGSHEQVGS